MNEEEVRSAETEIWRGGCKFCGSVDLYNRSVWAKNGSMMVFVICRDCRRSWSLQHIKNAQRRTSTTLTNWAYQVKKRDGYRCVICGNVDDLEAHHVIPVSVDPTLMYIMGNGLTLCHKCHRKVHEKD